MKPQSSTLSIVVVTKTAFQATEGKTKIPQQVLFVAQLICCCWFSSEAQGLVDWRACLHMSGALEKISANP